MEIEALVDRIKNIKLELKYTNISKNIENLKILNEELVLLHNKLENIIINKAEELDKNPEIMLLEEEIKDRTNEIDEIDSDLLDLEIEKKKLRDREKILKNLVKDKKNTIKNLQNQIKNISEYPYKRMSQEITLGVFNIDKYFRKPPVESEEKIKLKKLFQSKKSENSPYYKYGADGKKITPKELGMLILEAIGLEQDKNIEIIGSDIIWANDPNLTFRFYGGEIEISQNNNFTTIVNPKRAKNPKFNALANYSPKSVGLRFVTTKMVTYIKDILNKR